MVQYNGTSNADVKKRLLRLELKYAMLFPVRLRVTAGGPDVAAWLDLHEQDFQRRRPDNERD